MGWRLLAATGMRRGEALALRWRDVDLDAGRLAVRRSVGVVRTNDAGGHLVEGPTKTGQSRVVSKATDMAADELAADLKRAEEPAAIPGQRQPESTPEKAETTPG